MQIKFYFFSGPHGCLRSTSTGTSARVASGRCQHSVYRHTNSDSGRCPGGGLLLPYPARLVSPLENLASVAERCPHRHRFATAERKKWYSSNPWESEKNYAKFGVHSVRTVRSDCHRHICDGWEEKWCDSNPWESEKKFRKISAYKVRTMSSDCQLVNPFHELRSEYATIRDVRSRVTRNVLYSLIRQSTATSE